MKRLFIIPIILLSIFCSAFALQAQDISHQGIIKQIDKDSIELTIYFQRSYSTYSPNLVQKGISNEIRISDFDREFHKLISDKNIEIQYINIESAASPEGITRNNLRLSDRRAETLISQLEELLSEAKHQYRVTSHGIDWQGLDSLLSRSTIPYSAQMLDIVRNTPEFIYDKNNKIVDGRLRKLQMYRGGVPYNKIFEELFPELRYAKITIGFTRTTIIEPEPIPEPQPEPEPTPEPELIPEPQPDPTPEPQPVVMEKESKDVVHALKTNLLSDLALTPQIGYEVMLNDEWSIAANYHGAWWRPMGRYYYNYGGSVEVRRYWDPNNKYDTMSGHHFGAFAQILTYDVEGKEKGYLGKKPHVGLGVTYGYSVPLGRRLNLDMSIGIGYLTGKYEEYRYIDGHYSWQGTNRLHYFGPTKAELSLVWLIGQNNFNQKGGNK